ncbi:MAG: AarF/ABC1/UbiB kinase family protein [Microbacterium sp.]
MGHLSRYQEIADTLARHGLGFLAGAVGISRWIPSRRGDVKLASDQPYTTPQRVRLALEELGPTFVKLGQLLSTRPDLLPPAYITELSKLQDAAPPVVAEEIRQTIREELGSEPEQLFASFEWAPLASASIGQAHTATLADGTAVVVKVRRPDAVRQVNEDLEILTNLAERAARAWEPARIYNVPGIVQAFAQTLRAELDYLREAQNAERFAADFADRPDVVIPRVYWETTTSRVLTLERMTGIKINDLTQLDAAGVDRRELARTGTELVLRMLFEHRFFHADPHPGNLFVHPNGDLALIDFGMVGEITEELYERLADFFVAFTSRNPTALADALIDLSVTRGAVDQDALRVGLSSFIARYSGRPLSEIHFTQMTTDLLRMVREHHLQLPSEASLVFKVLIMIEGIGVQLDPDFDLNTVLTRYSRRLMREQLSVATLMKRMSSASVDTGALFLEMPGRLRRLLANVDRNGIEVHLRAAELDPLVGRAERIGNRLVAGMIAAALINGVGQLVVHENRWRSWASALMGAGLTAVTALGGYLVWTFRRRQ